MAKNNTVAQLKASQGFSNAVGLAVLKTCQESQEVQSYMTDPAFIAEISKIAAEALHTQHHSDGRPAGGGPS
jgi:type I restriction enzyme R subunit